MPKVIALCGKICSGKTFYANKIKEGKNAVILSTDEVTFYLMDNEQGERPYFKNTSARLRSW